MQLRWTAGAAAAILCTACSGGSSDGNGAPPTDAGARLYGQNCVPCHQTDGRGVPEIYPSLAGSAVVNGDAVALTRWVLSGKRPAGMPAGRYSTQMLQFGWLKGADAAALLSYVRASFGNRSAAIDAATIARARGD